MKQKKIRTKSAKISQESKEGKTPFEEYKKLEEEELAFLKSLTLDQAIKLTEILLRGAEEWSKCSEKSKQYYVRRN